MKRLSTRKKILIASLLVGVLVVGAIVSLVLVLAAQTQGVSSTINVTYVVEDVGAKVSARYAVVKTSTGEVSGDWVNLVNGSETEHEFDVGDSGNGVVLNPTVDEVKLSSSDSTIVYEYKFTNTTASPFSIILTKQPDVANPDEVSNMSVAYKSSAAEMSNFTTETVSDADLKNQILVEENATTYLYLKANVADLKKGAYYTGNIEWTLSHISSDDEKLKEVTLATADAQAFADNVSAYADGDITYKYYDDENYQLPHLTVLPEGEAPFKGLKIKSTGEKLFDKTGSSLTNVTMSAFNTAVSALDIGVLWGLKVNTQTWNSKTYYYVEMGEYPQTLYKYSDTVPSELTATSETINIDLSGTYGYTRSGEGSYTTTKGYGSATNAFTIYTDTSGNRYIWHKVCAYTTSTTSTNNLYMDGTTHTTDGLAFFKLEPMKFDILGYYNAEGEFVQGYDENVTEDIVVKSRDGLQGMSWNTENDLIDYPQSTIYDYLQSFYTNYLESDYSDYINSVDNTYYDADQSYYEEYYDKNGGYTGWGVNATLSGTKVPEKVWLIEREQAEEFFADNTSRLTSASDFALATCAYQHKNASYTTITKPSGGTCCWWLRSSFNFSGNCCAGYVSKSGTVNYNSVYDCTYAVVPALLINL